MTENTEKSVFLRCFDKELSDKDISSLTKEDLLELSNPSSFSSAHDSRRVIEFDAISEILIRYYNANEANNGYHIVLRVQVIPPVGDRCGGIGHRYQYHGGNHGLFDGYFTGSDKFYRFCHKSNKGLSSVDSIPHFNIAHFFCDYLDTDEKTGQMIDWICDNDILMKRLKELISLRFCSGDSK